MAGTVAQLSGMIRSKDEDKIAILEEIRKFDDLLTKGLSHSIQFMITDVVFGGSVVADGNKYTFSLSYLEYSCTSKKLNETVSISYSTEPQVAAEVKIVCYVDSDEGIEKNIYIVCRNSSDLHTEFNNVSSITLEAKSDADGTTCNLVATGKIIEFKQQLSEFQQKLQVVEGELDDLRRKLREESTAPRTVATKSPKKSGKKSKKSTSSSQEKPAKFANILVKNLASYTMKSIFFVYEYRAVALFGISSALIYSYGDYISV